MSLFEAVCCLRIRKPQFSLRICCLFSLCWVPGVCVGVGVGVGGVGGGLSLGVDVGVGVVGFWECFRAVGGVATKRSPIDRFHLVLPPSASCQQPSHQILHLCQ